MKLILASNSPRRKDLLAEAGFDFSVIVSAYDEKAFSSDPVETAVTFAEGKATDVFNSLKEKKNAVVLGADTVVYNRGMILNKPSGDEAAFQMLKGLSGQTHSVITGYCAMCEDEKVCGHVVTKVTFYVLTDDIILDYVKSGLYKGKSGGYGIQDPYPFVKRFEGSMNNVIGLPTEVLTPILKRMLNK